MYRLYRSLVSAFPTLRLMAQNRVSVFNILVDIEDLFTMLLIGFCVSKSLGLFEPYLTPN